MTTPTNHYNFGKPIVGADADTWGTELNTALDAIDSAIFANAAPSYTTVQQGGGVGQGTNKLFVGWGTSGGLKLTVDSTDEGFIPTSVTPNGFLRTSTATGGLVTYSASGPSGTPADGDFWVQYT